MQFAHPSLLWLLWLLPVVGLVFYLARGAARRRLEAFTGSTLRDELAGSVHEGRRVWRSILRVLVLALLIIAAARPQWGASEVEVEQSGIDLVVALDISRSMLADDIQPNRLARAKAELGEVIESLRGDRFGLVLFAGAAFPQCPLTVDYSAARLFLSQAEPSMISAQGTDISTALDVGVELFSEKEGRYRVILLVTDGEDFAGGIEEVRRRLESERVTVYVVGMGTAEGAPIPEFDDTGTRRGFVRDESGNVVMTRLDEGPLVDLARSTGGVYVRAGSTGLDVPRLLAELSAVEGRDFETQRVVSLQERFAWPLTAAMLLLLSEGWLFDRRRRA